MIFPTPNEKSFLRYLRSYGVQDSDLNVLKEYVENFGTKDTPLHRVNLTKMYQSNDKAINQLAVRIQNAAQELISTASPESSTYMAARARKAAESGTIPALASAFGMQFAGYVNGFYARQIGMTKYSKGSMKYAGLSSLVVLTTLGSMSELQIRNVLQGKEPEDVTPDLILKSFVRGGAVS